MTDAKPAPITDEDLIMRVRRIYMGLTCPNPLSTLKEAADRIRSHAEEIKRLRNDAINDPSVVKIVAARIHNLDLLELEERLRVAEEALSDIASCQPFSPEYRQKLAGEALAAIRKGRE